MCRKRRILTSRGTAQEDDVRYCSSFCMRPLWMISKGETSLSLMITAMLFNPSIPLSHWKYMYMSNIEIISTLKVHVKYPINLVFKYTLKWLQQIFKNIEKIFKPQSCWCSILGVFYHWWSTFNTQIVNWSTVQHIPQSEFARQLNTTGWVRSRLGDWFPQSPDQSTAGGIAQLKIIQVQVCIKAKHGHFSIFRWSLSFPPPTPVWTYLDPWSMF